MWKRELVALLNLSSWCLVMVEWLFLAMPWGCLRLLIVAFPDHTHLLLFADLLVDSTVRVFFSFSVFCKAMDGYSLTKATLLFLLENNILVLNFLTY